MHQKIDPSGKPRRARQMRAGYGNALNIAKRTPPRRTMCLLQWRRSDSEVDMQNPQLELERQQAWNNVKAAVRAYARNPSDHTAAQVEACWQTIRKCDSVHAWRTPGRAGKPSYRSRLLPPATRLARRKTTSGPWPINEIVMRSLLLDGMNERDIAEMYRVAPELVKERRRTLGL
jgi:hypothetical protein